MGHGNGVKENLNDRVIKLSNVHASVPVKNNQLSFTPFPCPFVAKLHPCLFILFLSYLLSQVRQKF